MINKLIVFVIIAFLLAGCSVDSIDEQNNEIIIGDKNIDKGDIVFSANDAISKVKEERDDFDSFPNTQGKVKGVINGGGKAPGIKVPGELETKVENIEEGLFIVTFTEYWNYADFHYEGKGTEGDVLSYYWKFNVTENNVELIESDGNFPPQLVK